MVVNQKIQVPYYKRNQLGQTMFFINKFGINNHKEKLKIKNKNYISHLLRKINFVLNMNPDDIEFKKYKLQLIELRKKHPFS